MHRRLAVPRRTIGFITGPAPELSGYPNSDGDVPEWLLPDHQ
jgi:hypothetical protein